MLTRFLDDIGATLCHGNAQPATVGQRLGNGKAQAGDPGGHCAVAAAPASCAPAHVTRTPPAPPCLARSTRDASALDAVPVACAHVSRAERRRGVAVGAVSVTCSAYARLRYSTIGPVWGRSWRPKNSNPSCVPCSEYLIREHARCAMRIDNCTRCRSLIHTVPLAAQHHSGFARTASLSSCEV